MGLKNVPMDAPQPLASLATCRPGQVQSVAFTPMDAPASLVLLAFSAGEGVSEETYGTDTLYYAAEGTGRIVVEGAVHALAVGEVLCVPAGVMHAVEASTDYKLLQLNL